MTDRRHDRRSLAPGTGIVALMLLCCAGPALVAAGALGALGAILTNPFVLAASAVLAVPAIAAWAVRRHHRDKTCCPPSREDQETSRE
ncbi:hypothetical protein [Actinokineospora sp.]|uniref:hypothetical protein n=1 Tax=Actinokineospora sp. TaxID=1872133 RepID=UPI003D6B4222